MGKFSFGGGFGGGGGAVTEEVYIPAVALFEHPEDATTLFAAAGGAAGLTVTLREPLEYGQDTSQWQVLGAQRYQGVAEIVGVAASVDLPTSGTGGIRVTAAVAGVAANAWTIRGNAGAVTAVTVVGTDYTVEVAPDGTAAAALAAINAHADLTAAYYGTETGTTVVRVGNGNVLAGWQAALDFSGGVDAAAEIPADPVHVVVDRDTMRITAYYNIAAGGALTEADTLDDLKGAFDTAAEGLSSEYVGGADANTQVMRPFADVSQFSQADLRGLRLALTDPVAAGAAGNNFGLVARERFAGGAEVTERQAHILIYTNTGRTGGIRVTLDADIQGLNEHGVPVDVSSGALGNEWTWVNETGTGNSESVRVSPANRQVIFTANRLGTDETIASQVLSACNQGGTGVAATTFGGYGGSRHVFRGSLGALNASINRFHDGRDYHAATGNPEPITVTVGPTHAHTRLYTAADGGIVLSLTNPAHDAGNGFDFEASEGALAWAVIPNQERITLAVPAAGALASAILAAANAHDALQAAYFGTEDGTTNVLPTRFGRHELLGGLDATEIEIQYAPEAKGGITTPDTMGDVKTAWDNAAQGRRSFYYGGADAATTASRLTPWEHRFENGETDTLNLSGFALGPEQNEFTGADRAAAEAARDTYATANPTWVEAYRGKSNVWIALRWGTDQVGQVLRANASNPPVAGDWIDQNLALMGDKGNPGAQGAYDVDIYQNAAANPGPPVGGTVVVATGVTTPPAGWTATETQPPAGQDTYRSRARINPATQSGTVVPTWGTPVDIRAEVSTAEIDARIAPPARAVGATGEFDAARIPDLGADKITSGELDDARIPAGVTRDSEDIAASRVTGALADSNIPAGIARDTEVTAAITSGVKEFARAGERGVQVGDMDSESAADNQVPTADGSGGVAWEAQQGGGGTPPVQMHLRYAAIRTADAMFTAADFTAAEATTSQTNTIDTPDTTDNAYLAFAIPNDVNDLSDIRQENGLFSYFGSFTLSQTLITLDGEDHKVYISNFALDAALIGGNWVLTPS